MTTETKHTPGPWMADRADNGATAIILANDPEGHAFNMAYLRYEYPERDANARLMAAAPDLLVALKLVAEAFKNDSHKRLFPVVFATVDAAIQKATTA